jgi:hypothetical protein
MLGEPQTNAPSDVAGRKISRFGKILSLPPLKGTIRTERPRPISDAVKESTGKNLFGVIHEIFVRRGHTANAAATMARSRLHTEPRYRPSPELRSQSIRRCWWQNSCNRAENCPSFSRLLLTLLAIYRRVRHYKCPTIQELKRAS